MLTSDVSTSADVKATQEIKISLDDLKNGNYYFPYMKVGETVRYTSSEGTVTIHLNGHSPFHLDLVPTGTQVPGGVILTMVKSSEGLGLPHDAFQLGCSLTLFSDGTTVGWPELSKAGGEQGVGRPGPH